MSKGNAFKYGYKVGDVVVFAHTDYVVNESGLGIPVHGGRSYLDFCLPPQNYKLKSVTKSKEINIKVSDVFNVDIEKMREDKPSGGPSKYYDFPFQDWVTVNDMVEYLAKSSWHHDSWIFKDIVKACTRWGMKNGTTKDYDARKIIYYGLRLLMSVSGKKAVQEYLTELSNDNQFK